MAKKHSLSLNKELKRITRVLKKKYKPEKIILFGSAAAGRVKRWSDLDIAVIKNTQKRFYDRIGEVLMLADPHEAVDFIVYTPQEFKDMQSYSWFVNEEIVKKGKVVYEKNA